MTQTISLADMTVANDGPVDQLEYARRTVMASQALNEFTACTAAPALETVLALAQRPSAVDLARTRALADELSSHATALLAEVERFTAMASRR